MQGISNYEDYTDMNTTAIDCTVLGPEERYYHAISGRTGYYSSVDLEKEAEMKKTGFFKALFRKKNKITYGVDSMSR